MNKVWHAMADETRREILKLLKERDMCATEIARHFDTTQATISHHLSILRKANLVINTKSAQTITYSLNTTVWQEFCCWLVSFMKKGKGENND